MRVAIFSTKEFDRTYLDRYNYGTHDLTYFQAPLNAHTTNLTRDFDAVCVFVNDHIDQDTIRGLAENGVQLIALRCAGFNNVDLATAHSAGIPVVRVPAYSPQAVAEHAVALILTLNRKTHKAYNRIREGNFSLEKLTGFDLQGKTVGVVGTGGIGVIFCRIMLGFGCQVLAYDLYPKNDVSAMGVRYVPLNELLKSSNIISLHCPLTPETYHLISDRAFKKMKRGTMLINTSRGALIDTQAAIEALKDGTLGYLGIDVYEQEEHLFFKDLSEHIIQDDVIARLTMFPNVLITAHQGFFTEEALEEIAVTTIANLTAFENREPLVNEVKSTNEITPTG